MEVLRGVSLWVEVEGVGLEGELKKEEVRLDVTVGVVGGFLDCGLAARFGLMVDGPATGGSSTMTQSSSSESSWIGSSLIGSSLIGCLLLSLRCCLGGRKKLSSGPLPRFDMAQAKMHFRFCLQPRRVPPWQLRRSRLMPS